MYEGNHLPKGFGSIQQALSRGGVKQEEQFGEHKTKVLPRKIPWLMNYSSSSLFPPNGHSGPLSASVEGWEKEKQEPLGG